jgi:uncharacterized protein YdaU (DUF1376 family)
MSEFPSLPLFTDAFIADTGHLGAIETGAYLMLLMVAWRSPDCRLPDDDGKLARWARVDPRTWRRIKAEVMAFWTLAGGGWTQKRLLKEREIVSKRAEVARENGKRGGRPKSLKDNTSDNPAGLSRATQEKAPNPNPSKNVEPKGSTGAAAPVYTDSRHELWGEAVPILMTLGLSERRSGQMIGSWLKQTGDDVQQVLGAIQRARDHRPQEPIPWITRALKSPKVDNAKRAHGAHDNFLAGMAAALSERPESRLYAGKDSAGSGPDAGPAEDDREPLLRLAAR